VSLETGARSAGAQMYAVLNLISTVINIYIFLLIASAIMSWLVAFNVIDFRNQFVRQIGQFLYNITEPPLRPIRRIIPNLGGIDISPMVLILILIFVQDLLVHDVGPALL
jgi:YggT family protein